MVTIDTPRSRVAWHRVAIAAAAAGLTLVGGCGDTDSSSSATGVASLQSPGATTAATTPATPAE